MKKENGYPFDEVELKIHDLNEEWQDDASPGSTGRRKGETGKVPENIRRTQYGVARSGRAEERRAYAGGAERKRRREKKRKRRSGGIVFPAVLCLLALTAVTGCVVLLLENRKLQNEVQVAMAYVEEVNAVTTYTEEEVHAMTAEAAAKAAEQSSSEKEMEILGEIRTRMENGEGTAPVLRSLYKDELVVAADGRYYFFPIVDTLKHHSYQSEQFQMNEDGILEYLVDGNVASKKGIDVSRYQEKIDWRKVAGDGVDYAFIRLGIRGATEGKLVLDTTYEDNMDGALDNGIDVGVYFFTQALDKEEAVEEAEFVLEHLDGYDVTYPIVLDVEEVTTKNPRTEDLTKEERTQACIAFCERIKEAGYTPMIYGNLKTFLLMLDMEQLEEYEKWFAFYQTPLYFPYEFSVWQYTSTGSVNGIKGDVDMNVSMKDWGKDD